ncbi:MAG: helix-turn-helix transcriptional regulator [Gemmatimonadales bacterium]
MLIVAVLRLSPREAEVAKLLVNSHTIPEIASILGLSPFTVQTYLKRVYSKADVGNRFDLLLLATRIVLKGDMTAGAEAG